MRSGIALAGPTFFATAPASKFNHADDWFSRVTQTVPKSVSSSALAILSFYRAPPIAVVIGHPWTDALNNPLQPIMESRAIDRLGSPLQPMKTRMISSRVPEGGYRAWLGPPTVSLAERSRARFTSGLASPGLGHQIRSVLSPA
jgi:hypothetical protein